MERRRSPRIAVDAIVQLQIDDVMLEVPACDVSLHGIALSAHEELDLAEGDLVALILSDTVRLPAAVVRTGSARLHLAFVEANLENIRTFVEVLGDGPQPVDLPPPG